jgi:hypothetical protein
VEWFSASDDWLSRWIFERGLAVTYLIAFAVVINQFRPLLGDRGLMPARRFVAQVPFHRSPSLFHWRCSDRVVAGVGWVGIVVAALLLLEVPQRAAAPLAMAAWALLWALYLSVVNVGQRFYSFGWESLLLEVGFLAVFLGGSSTEPPVLVLWLLRWLLFRLELGAGLIKLRGDPCWRQLTCLEHHHETQPMPGPLSSWFHHLPKPLHRVEVLANHAAQLVVPWFLFAPEPLSTVAAVVVVVTQGYLVISGNFAWLNFLTIVLALSVIDGSVLAEVLPVDAPGDLAVTPGWQTGLTIALTVLVAVLSWRIVVNMLSPHQRMNASFDPLHLVNTYGAFGSVTKVRREVIIEGTLDRDLGPDAEWREYEVRGKPGDVRRRPPQVAPYHLRLGWLLWFVALSPGYGDGWLRPLMVKLLEADQPTLKLFTHDPFEGERPAYVRLRLYRYELATRAERRKTGAWWKRQPVGVLEGPAALQR